MFLLGLHGHAAVLLVVVKVGRLSSELGLGGGLLTENVLVQGLGLSLHQQVLESLAIDFEVECVLALDHKDRLTFYHKMPPESFAKGPTVRLVLT